MASTNPLVAIVERLKEKAKAPPKRAKTVVFKPARKVKRKLNG